MSLQRLMTNYAEYNAWANSTLIEWVSGKPAEALTAEVTSSFPSILKTLNHILSVQEYWFSIITETAPSTSRYGATELVAEEVIADLLANSKQVAEYVAGLSAEELGKTILVESPWFGSNLSRYEYIQHMLNHSTYHRGQVTSMGHHIGQHDAPMTDYNFYNVMMAETIAS